MRTGLRTFICLLTVVVVASTASALLMNPILQNSPDGFTGNVTEQETSCSYDKNSWAPSMTPPPGCQPLVSSDWPQWLHDAGHSGYNPDERVVGPSNVGKLHALWMMYTPGYSPDTFAVANGILYAFAYAPGDYQQQNPGLYALNATTGFASVPRWVIPAGQFDSSCLDLTVRLRLTVDGGLVYLGCGGQFSVIDATTGAILHQEPLWYECGGFSYCPFTVYNGGMYWTGWQFVKETDWQNPGSGWLFELGYLEGSCYFGRNYCWPDGFASVDNRIALWNYNIYQQGRGISAQDF